MANPPDPPRHSSSSLGSGPGSENDNKDETNEMDWHHRDLEKTDLSTVARDSPWSTTFPSTGMNETGIPKDLDEVALTFLSFEIKTILEAIPETNAYSREPEVSLLLSFRRGLGPGVRSS